MFDKKEKIDEELEQQRQENTEAYGKKISELKAEEVALNNKIAIVKANLDEASAAFSKAVEEKSEELNVKMAEADGLTLKSKEIIKDYEARFVALGSDKEKIEAMVLEADKRIKATNESLAAQGEALSHKLAEAEELRNSLAQQKIEHDINVNKLAEDQEANKAEAEHTAEAKASLAVAKEQLEAEQAAHAENVRVLNETRSDYITKNAELASRAKSLEVIKQEQDNRTERLNEQKSKLDDISLQLKIERAALDKEKEEFNNQQLSAAVQIQKLEALKTQVKES